MCHVPDAGKRGLEVHVVRKQGLAGSGAAPGQGPGVGPRLDFAPRPHGKKKLDLPAIALLDHVALEKLVAPTRGQGAEHLQPDQNGIDAAPGPGLIAEQREFHGKVAPVRGDEGIDAARIGGQGGAIAGREVDIVGLGGAPDSETTRFAVAVESHGADDFGEVAGRGTAKGIHLPEPVLRCYVSLDDKGIFLGGRADVGYAQGIKGNGDGMFDWHGEDPRPLRQRAPGVPIDQQQGQQDQYADHPVDGGDQPRGKRSLHVTEL